MGRKKKIDKEEESGDGGPGSYRHRHIAADAKRSAVAVFLFALGLVIILGFFGKAGVVGDKLDDWTGMLIGWSRIILPLFLFAAGVVLLMRKETAYYATKLIGLTITLIGITAFFHRFYAPEKMIKMAEAGEGGGYLGYWVASLAVKYLGNAGGLVVILAIFLTGFIVAFNFSILHFLEKLFGPKEEEETEAAEFVGAPEEKKEVEAGSSQEAAKPKEDENIGKIEFVDGPDRFSTQVAEKASFQSRKLISQDDEKILKLLSSTANAGWQLPPTDLLEKSKGGAEGGDTERNAEIIEKTFKSFGIEVERGGIQIGPSVTQYSFRPAVGIKVSKILELNSNLALALAKHPIRIEAPIPGKSLIGVEVPNHVPAVVRLRDLVESEQFRAAESHLTLALGEDVSGEYILADLGKMPHLLIAGATGTGKSVSINSIITTLLYQNSPDDLKFIMVDPKRVELSMYSGIPHLLSPVITDNHRVINALKWVVGEMERRYRLLQDMHSQNIDSYNEKRSKGEKKKQVDPETGQAAETAMEKLPYIVVVIDELAELMMSHGKDVEGAIVRIAQLARAVGIHLVVSTQRPEVKVITGLIKANINARIAFKVNTQVDSRTILDVSGAEKLLGSGDMLYLSAASPKTKRIQGIFVSESEVKKVVKFIKDQADRIRKEQGEAISEGDEIGIGADISTPTFEGATSIDFSAAPESEKDDLYEAAKEEVIRAGKASASLLQRRLRVGYARAARLLDILEDDGIIGPADGAKPRDVYTSQKPAEGMPQEVSYDSPIEDQTVRDKWNI